MTRLRLVLFLPLGLLAAGMALLAWGYRAAVADPLVREADVALPGWPAGQPPLRACSSRTSTSPDRTCG